MYSSRPLLLAFVAILFLSSPALAAGPKPPDLHPLWVLPFVLLLLTIAVLPLFAEHWWHKNRNKALVSLLFALPVAAYLLYLGPTTGGAPTLVEELTHFGRWLVYLEPPSHAESTHALEHLLREYVSFIILLGSLYTVAGGIVLRGDIQGKPFTNGFFFVIGAVLANLIGTTGASMLLIRPVLRINRQRKNVGHIPIFFIFMVSNLGGLLTPLGDPPLFLGFRHGVDFFWTLSLWPQWLLANGLVLMVFLVWDSYAYSYEDEAAIRRDVEQQEPLGLAGLYNLLFLGGIVVAVLFQSETVGTAAGEWIRQYVPAAPDLTLPHPSAELTMVAMALLSLLFTPRRLREANGFGWGAIVEVAVLFAGIFVTMVPALALLILHGRTMTQQWGVGAEWHYFWMTGGLSSFLDNAPTYMVFATLAAGSNELAPLMTDKPLILAAISCGAVFMGANTYIGNGPNFMVKAIADEAGFKTPSFFGYMLYSGFILLPIFGVLTAVFFLPK